MNGEPIIQTMDFNALRGLSDRCAFWYKPVKNAEKDEHDNDTYREQPMFPNKDVIHNMRAYPSQQLPNLIGITHVPSFAANGVLQIERGYNPDTKLYFHPAYKGQIPRVSAKPSPEEVLAARNLITEDLIYDFPFDNRANDEGYVIAMLLQPFMRNMIPGFCPFFLIDKPQAGTGATLLAQSVISIITGGDTNALSSMDLAGGEAEVGKKFLAAFSTSPAVIFLDNLVGELISKRLTETITSPSYSDRVLGRSQMASYPVRNLWIGTGNNPKMSSDLVRRTIRIRMDANIDRPEMRKHFKHQNLDVWVEDNLPQLIHACLTIIQYWITQGKPIGTAKLGGFRGWSDTMGGITDLLDLRAGLLSNHKKMHDYLDDESESWLFLCKEWWKTRKDESISSSAVVDMIGNIQSDVVVQRGTSESGFISAVGQALAKMKDKRFGPYTIKVAKPVKNTKRWSLIMWEDIDDEDL